MEFTDDQKVMLVNGKTNYVLEDVPHTSDITDNLLNQHHSSEKRQNSVWERLGFSTNLKQPWPQIPNDVAQLQDEEEAPKPKFKYVFCDMDGTLLNSKSKISSTTAKALKDVSSRGLNIVIATGKTRSAVIDIFKMVNLAGKDGIVSEFSPGVFCQGLLVYGTRGQEVSKLNLDQNVCREACLYSLENKIPLVAYCEDRCFTLFDHPLVDSLHTIYHEPKGEIMPSIDHLLAAGDIQKVIFMDTAKGVATMLRPYWSAATGDRATVVQAQPDMLEIVPKGTSKGSGVKMLLDHLGISPEEIMAIGDGENDVEMLQMASLGIALSNGSEKAKAAANIIGSSNDEDGAAEAIYRYAF